MPNGELVRELIESQSEAWEQVLREDLTWPFTGRVLCIGSGSSYHAALTTAFLARKSGLDVTAMPTQDVILEGGSALSPFDDVVVISRSGETTEALLAADMARAYGKQVWTVTCRDDAPLLSHAENSLALPYAHDHTVVMIRSFTCMLLAFERVLARGNSEVMETLEHMVSESHDFVGAAHTVIGQVMDPLPRRVYILGAGVRHGIALEGALKALEMSNENASAYGPLEFRHGPWGSLTDQDLVVVLGETRYGYYERQVVRDLAERTPHLLVVAQESWAGRETLPGEKIVLPEGDGLWLGPLAAVPLQWLAFEWALGLGRNPDMPQNLEPVVNISRIPEQS